LVTSLTETAIPVKPNSNNEAAENPRVEPREQSKIEGCAALP